MDYARPVRSQQNVGFQFVVSYEHSTAIVPADAREQSVQIEINGAIGHRPPLRTNTENPGIFEETSEKLVGSPGSGFKTPQFYWCFGEVLVPKKGLRPEVLLVFSVLMVKRRRLKLKEKGLQIFGIPSFPINIGEFELSRLKKNGRKW